MAVLLFALEVAPSVDFGFAADAEPGEPPLRPDSALPVHWFRPYLVAALLLPEGFSAQMESLAAIEQEETFRHFANSVFSAIPIGIDPRVLRNLRYPWTLSHP